MKRLKFALNLISIVSFGAAVALFATNNVGDSAYFGITAVFARVWGMEEAKC